MPLCVMRDAEIVCASLGYKEMSKGLMQRVEVKVDTQQLDYGPLTLSTRVGHIACIRIPATCDHLRSSVPGRSLK